MSLPSSSCRCRGYKFPSFVNCTKQHRMSEPEIGVSAFSFSFGAIPHHRAVVIVVVVVTLSSFSRRPNCYELRQPLLFFLVHRVVIVVLILCRLLNVACILCFCFCYDCDCCWFVQCIPMSLRQVVQTFTPFHPSVLVQSIHPSASCMYEYAYVCTYIR